MSSSPESFLPDPFPIPMTCGGQVSPHYVIPRPEIEKQWWGYLEVKSSRLTSLRRIGKTTRLKLLASNPIPGWVGVYIQVQDVKSLEGLINRIMTKLVQDHSLGNRLVKVLKKFSGSLRKVAKLRSVKVVGLEFVLDSDLAKNPGDALYGALKDIVKVLETQNLKMVIVLDEFTDMLRNVRDNVGIAEAMSILSVLRMVREVVCGERIRWFLSGSVGFHHVLRSMPEEGRSLVDDVTEAKLGSLNSATAIWFANCLLLDIKVAVPVAAKAAPFLAQASSGIPFVLDLMVKHLYDKPLDPPESLEAAQHLLRQMAAGLDLGTSWTPMLSKVQKDYYGEDADVADAILDMLASEPLPTNAIETALDKNFDVTNRQVKELLTLLKSDDYLVYDPDTKVYSWQYDALRNIWCTARGI